MMERRRTKCPSVVHLCAFVIACLWGHCRGLFDPQAETDLRKILFNVSTYDISVAPERPVIVSLTFVPSSLTKIDLVTNTMSIAGWWKMTWRDSRLTWDPRQHGSVHHIHSFQHKMWRPTTVIYNSIHSLPVISAELIPLLVESNGNVSWNPTMAITVDCQTDVTYFPLDSQKCSLKVKALSYSVKTQMFDMNASKVDTSYFSINGEWTLISTDVSHFVFEDCDTIWFNFLCKRKPWFHLLNLVIPVISLSFLCIFVYALPPESGERMGLTLTAMVAFILLMTLVSERIPSTAEHVSYFDLYVILVLCLSCFSVILSIINLNVFFTDDTLYPIAPWKRRLTILILRVLCLRLDGTCAWGSRQPAINEDSVAPMPESDSMNMDNNRYGSWRMYARPSWAPVDRHQLSLFLQKRQRALTEEDSSSSQGKPSVEKAQSVEESVPSESSDAAVNERNNSADDDRLRPPQDNIQSVSRSRSSQFMIPSILISHTNAEEKSQTTHSMMSSRSSAVHRVLQQCTPKRKVMPELHSSRQAETQEKQRKIRFSSEEDGREIMEEDMVTWQMLAHVLDVLLFRLFLVVWCFCGVVFVSLMASHGRESQG